MNEKKKLSLEEAFGLALYNHKKKKFKIAEDLYKKILSVYPNNLDSHNNLGILFKDLGRYEESLEHLKKVILLNPDFTLGVNNLCILIREIQIDDWTKIKKLDLKKIITLLFERNDINHRDLLRNTIALLFPEKNINEIKKALISDFFILENQVIQNILLDELFFLMLQKSLVADQFVEKVLIKLRNEILCILNDKRQNILKEKINFIISLAEQCFLNEYIYLQSVEEINIIKNLIKKEENNAEINELKIAILACYIPLLSYKNLANKLHKYKSKNNLFNDLINMQINEPLKEKNLIQSVKSLGKISNVISKKVRDQYEKYPYPRWRYTYSNSPSNYIDIINNQINPNKIKKFNKYNNPNVLVAGCGTGNHICQTANYLNANILGIDLSLASIGYAKRKVEELGIKNIEFLHADILQLKNQSKKFDVIECVGVLHHMQDPLMGLKILLKLLKPDGLLLLGLYSEKARQDIIKVKEFVKKNKFKDSFSGIKNFRKAVLNEKEDLSLQRLSGIRDFYSTSSIKDLIFHAQEHHFTLQQIFQILNDLNLDFLGFCDAKVKNDYSKLFPDDKEKISFNNWQQYEALKPLAFLKMYTFWIRKKNKNNHKT